MAISALIIALAEIWAYLGLAVAAVFLTVGIGRVEPNALGAYTFRPLLIPGIVLLWPLVVWRWAVLETGRDRPLARHAPPRKGHARLWLVCAVLIPAILVTGLLVRQDRTAPLPAPVQLTEPDR